jgi:hypothetical protein
VTKRGTPVLVYELDEFRDRFRLQMVAVCRKGDTTMTAQNPLRTGFAFAATVAIGYTLCTLVFWLWPDAAANYMSGLFHGLDFRKLQGGPELFNFASFLYVLVVSAVWAFGLATLFALLRGRAGA